MNRSTLAGVADGGGPHAADGLRSAAVWTRSVVRPDAVSPVPARECDRAEILRRVRRPSAFALSRVQCANPTTNKFCGECGAKLGASGPAAATVAPAAAAASPQAAASPTTSPAEPASTGPPRFASPEAYTPKHLVEKILTSKTAVEGERKQVTVMFTDVSGFTSLSERLDPEDVHALMDRAFGVILEAIHGYEGTVNQFLGDGVMALFGAPIAHEDHAGRALRAALAIQEKLGPIRADVRQMYGRDFLMRIGINTGLVVVGAIGRDLRMDYTALGDTVNLASRLLNVAQPGQIVASRHTKELCEGFFEFEDLGDFQVKGKTEPQRAFAVKGELGGRTRLEVSRERGLTPLIGRAEERERLAAVFRKAASGGGGVVLLAGEPGVGKSRLLYEFLRQPGRHRASGDRDDVRVLWPRHGVSSAGRTVSTILRSPRGPLAGGRQETNRGAARRTRSRRRGAGPPAPPLPGPLGTAGVPPTRAGPPAPKPHARDPGYRHLSGERAEAGGPGRRERPLDRRQLGGDAEVAGGAREQARGVAGADHADRAPPWIGSPARRRRSSWRGSPKTISGSWWGHSAHAARSQNRSSSSWWPRAGAIRCTPRKSSGSCRRRRASSSRTRKRGSGRPT